MARLIEDDEGVASLVRSLRRVAVLGIKTEAQASAPAYSVPAYLAGAGVQIVPVPVYYPEATQILGQPVFRSLAAVPGPVDLIDVFRRPHDLEAHFDDFLSKKPAAVWFQLGIRHDALAARLVAAGVDVVQDRCLLVEHQRWAR